MKTKEKDAYVDRNLGLRCQQLFVALFNCLNILVKFECEPNGFLELSISQVERAYVIATERIVIGHIEFIVDYEVVIVIHTRQIGYFIVILNPKQWTNRFSSRWISEKGARQLTTQHT